MRAALCLLPFIPGLSGCLGKQPLETDVLKRHKDMCQERTTLVKPVLYQELMSKIGNAPFWSEPEQRYILGHGQAPCRTVQGCLRVSLREQGLQDLCSCVPDSHAKTQPKGRESKQDKHLSARPDLSWALHLPLCQVRCFEQPGPAPHAPHRRPSPAGPARRPQPPHRRGRDGGREGRSAGGRASTAAPRPPRPAAGAAPSPPPQQPGLRARR